MKIALLYNPNAANGRAAKLIPKVKAAFEDRQVEADFLLTKSRGHATELTAQIDFSLYDGVVAAGGDGTLFEVVNGYYQNTSDKRIPLGVLPTGTGNAFARELDLRKNDWQKAVRIIAGRKTKKIDVGRFRTNDKIYHFVNILGFGFVGDVNKTAQGFKILGNFAYTLGVFYRIVFLKPFHLRMQVNGETIERKNIFVEISNTRYTGTSFLMAPRAKIDDGLLNITLLNKINRRGLLKIFPTIFDGSHLKQKQVETFTADHIVLEAEPAKALTPDGELLGSTPIEVRCLKEDLEFFWS